MMALKLWALIKGVPWQIYIAAAIMLAFPITYCKGVTDGKAAVYAKLEKAEQEAKKAAAKSLNNATNAKQKRDIENEAKAEALQEVIDEAVANDENALDAIF